MIEIVIILRGRSSVSARSLSASLIPYPAQTSPARVWTFGSALLCGKPGNRCGPLFFDHELDSASNRDAVSQAKPKIKRAIETALRSPIARKPEASEAEQHEHPG